MTVQTTRAAFYRGNKSFAVEQKQASPPKADEVVLRIAYCGVCGTDMHVYHGHMDSRVGHNRILGHEMSGIVEAVGENVDNVKAGQKAVVRPLDHCGACPACRAGHEHICHSLKFLGLDTDGAMQELWNVPAHTIHILPDSIRMDHAALIEPLAVACHDVRLSAIKEGEDVLVIGGGPIGVLVAMVASQAGGNVVLSEVNTHRLAIAKKLGFTTINPSEQDLAGFITEQTAQKGADVIFEVSGTQAGVASMTECAASKGRIVMVAIHASKPEIDLFQFFWRELTLIGARVYTAEDYEKAISLISDGSIKAAEIITDISPLEKIQTVFEELDSNPSALKSLIKIGDEQ